MSTPAKPLGELSPDYAILLAFPQHEGKATQEAQENLSKLVAQLSKHGFHSQARPADNDQLLLFVKVSDSLLLKQLKGEGVKEYLYGLRGELDTDESLIQHLTTTTKLSAVHALLTDPEHEGGAGITTGSPEWSFVTKVSPVWDYDENKSLLKSLFKLNFTEEDVEKIRAVAGDKVALYFAFVRFYLNALIGPAVLGLGSHLLFKRFSLLYTVLNSVWAIVFLAAWRKKQSVYSLKWKTAGSSKVEIRRTEFRGEALDTDPVTGQSIPSFSPIKRTARELAFLPIALVGIAILVSYQVSCFFIEILLTEIYQGPGKALLGLVPTVLIVGVVPILTSVYQKFVNRALEFENHEYQSTYDRSKTQKMYVYNFLSSYVPLFITVFFYLPFGHVVNNYVSTIATYSSKYNIPVVSEKYQINNDRLINQFSYFTLTAQIVGFGVENILPVSIRLIKEKFGASKAIAKNLDSPQEAAYLNNVRQQLAMPEFDVDAEYRELVTQFGFLVLFGPVWTLAPLVSLVFNWIEIRGDAEKLLFESSRPVPRQTESVAPWDTHIRILTWLGSFTGPLVTVMYRRHSEVLASSTYNHFTSPVITPGWKLASTALIAENVALGINFAVEWLFQSSTSQVEKEHSKKELLLRRSYVSAYAQDASVEQRSIEIDPTSSSWKTFSSENVVKAAITFPGLIAAAKAATAKINASDKNQKINEKKTTSESVETAADSVPSASKSGFSQHADDAEIRSTAASKAIPKTSVPSIAVTNDSPTTESTATATATDTSANAVANPFNAGVSSTTARDAVVGGGLASSLASSVGVKSSEVPSPSSKSDAVSTVPSDRTGINIPVATFSESTREPVSAPKKKKGLFGFTKKDAKSVGKAVKTDATKVAPQLKAAGVNITHGDFSGAKKDVAQITKNPEEFVGHTKKALDSAKTDKSVDASTGASGSVPSAPLPSIPSYKEDPSSASGLADVGTGATVGTDAATAVNGSNATTGTSDAADISNPVDLKKPINDGKEEVATVVPSSGVTGTLGGIAAAVGITGLVGSQSTSDETSSSAPTTSESTELKSSTASDSKPDPTDSTVDSSPSAPTDTATKPGLFERVSSSTQSSSSTSLAGATLPPDFEKKAAALGYRTSASPSATSTPSVKTPVPSTHQTGYNGSSSDAFGSQPAAALSNTQTPSNTPATVSTPQKKTLDPAKTSTPDSSNLKTGGAAAVAATGLVGSGVAISNHASSNGESSQKASSNLTEEATQGSYLDTAKEYAEKGGKSFNNYVQLAADKADAYAKKSDNEYVNKGNAYVQKLADGVEDYTQKLDATSTPKQNVHESTGQNVASQPTSARVSENVNPHTSDLKTDGFSDELAPPVKIHSSGAGDSHSATSSDVASPGKKKRGLLSKIKEKVVVHSPSSSPSKH